MAELDRLFRQLTPATVFFSQFIGAASDGLHGAKRLTEYLRLPLRNSIVQPIDDDKLSVDAVGTFAWPKAIDAEPVSPFGLTLDLRIARNELVAIVGPIGCGKTALCRALLDGLDCASGHLKLASKVFGTDQRTYLLSGASLRNQIIFSSSVDEQLYRQVLEWTALDQDVQSFPQGDRTVRRART